jgi:hypothetical protein
MVYQIDILVKDTDPIFDWIDKNVPAQRLVRYKAKGVNYEMVKAGAIISTCPASSPDFGWMVKIVVKDLETANFIVSTWKPLVDRCLGP